MSDCEPTEWIQRINEFIIKGLNADPVVINPKYDDYRRIQMPGRSWMQSESLEKAIW